MGKIGGFLEIDREDFTSEDPIERIKHFNEFHHPLSKKKQKEQGARCMDCGVPFCQYGQKVVQMDIGSPLNKLIPE